MSSFLMTAGQNPRNKSPLLPKTVVGKRALSFSRPAGYERNSDIWCYMDTCVCIFSRYSINNSSGSYFSCKSTVVRMQSQGKHDAELIRGGDAFIQTYGPVGESTVLAGNLAWFFLAHTNRSGRYSFPNRYCRPEVTTFCTEKLPSVVDSWTWPHWWLMVD